MRADAQRNYERILMTGRELAQSYGTTMSMDEVARRAKVGSGTLYRHFPTRNDLLLAIYTEDAEHLADQGRSLLRERKDGSALRAWAVIAAEYIAERPGLAAATLAPPVASDGSLCSFHAELKQIADALLDDARERGVARHDIDARAVLTLISATALACEGSLLQFMSSSDLVGLLFDGIAIR